MDNKTKCLYVAIAILLASNGYLLYRLGNAEGKTEPVAGSNEEPKAKDNTPIGKYIPEGEGLIFDDVVVINKIYLRDDGKVEINDKVDGHWGGKGKNYEISGCAVMFGKLIKVHEESMVGTRSHSVNALYIRFNDKHLTITGYKLRKESGLSGTILGYGGKLISLTEKDFIRYKRVE